MPQGQYREITVSLLLLITEIPYIGISGKLFSLSECQASLFDKLCIRLLLNALEDPALLLKPRVCVVVLRQSNSISVIPW